MDSPGHMARTSRMGVRKATDMYSRGFLMRTTLELLAEQLAPFGDHLVMRNRTIAQVDCFTRDIPRDGSRNPSCLYLLDGKDSSSLAAIGRTGSYLISHHFNTELSSAIGPDSNVLKVSHDVDREAVGQVLESFFAGVAAVEEHSLAIMSALSSRSGIRQLCEIASRILENPVAIVDLNLNTIMCANEPGKTDEYWEIIVSGKAPQYIGSWPGKWKDVDPGDISTIGPHLSVLDSSYSYRWIRVGICPNKLPRYMFVSPEVNRPFVDRDYTVSIVFAELIEDVLPRQSGQYVDPGNLLISILEGGIDDPKLVAKSLSDSGIKIGNETYLCDIYDQAAVPTYLQTIHCADAIRRRLGGTVVVKELDVVALLSPGKAHVDLTAELKSILEEAGDGWRAAVSYPFDAPAEVQRAWEQCQSVRRFDAKIPSRTRVLNFSSRVVLDLLERARQSSDLSRYCHPLARRILDYDKANGTEYARTLYYYLKAFRQTEMTADLLSVHRNTVFYRLERIQSLFRVNFDDVGLLSAIMLSFDILLDDDEPSYLLKPADLMKRPSEDAPRASEKTRGKGRRRTA